MNDTLSNFITVKQLPASRYYLALAGGYSICSIKNHEAYNERQQQEHVKKPWDSHVADTENSTKDKRRTMERHARDKTNKENKEKIICMCIQRLSLKNLRNGSLSP
jgi:hypothetical protein